MAPAQERRAATAARAAAARGPVQYDAWGWWIGICPRCGWVGVGEDLVELRTVVFRHRVLAGEDPRDGHVEATHLSTRRS
jgi:hypothetical protein